MGDLVLKALLVGPHMRPTGRFSEILVADPSGSVGLTTTFQDTFGLLSRHMSSRILQTTFLLGFSLFSSNYKSSLWGGKWQPQRSETSKLALDYRCVFNEFRCKL